MEDKELGEWANVSVATEFSSQHILWTGLGK